MSLDIGDILERWPSDPDGITARKIVGDDGAELLQLRLDVGILQMVLDGRPDGQRPKGKDSWLEWLEQKASTRQPAAIDHQDWAELDREMMQFYHRRIALLACAQSAQARKQYGEALGLYRRAAHDAEHNLRALDFIKAHSDQPEYKERHERYRAFILTHRTQAIVNQHLLQRQPEEAIDQIKAGIRAIEQIYLQHEAEEMVSQDPMLERLRAQERTIRQRYGIERTLSEQLQEALEKEDFEQAAILRDQIRRRQAERPDQSQLPG